MKLRLGMNKLIDSKYQTSENYWHNKGHLFSSIYATRNPLKIPNRLFLERRMKVVKEFLDDDKYAQVVDIGCGSGEFTRVLSQYYGKVIGVDYSSLMIHTAMSSNTAKNVSFLEANCTSVPLDNECADAVFSMGLLDYVDNVDAAISEFARLLKPGGTVIFTIPKSPSLFAPLRWSTYMRSLLFEIPPILNAYRRSQVDESLLNAGLLGEQCVSIWTTMWVVCATKTNIDVDNLNL